MNLRKTGKVFMSKFVPTGPSSYKKKNLPGRGLTKVEKHCSTRFKPEGSSSGRRLYVRFIVVISANQ
jgi:hypothetical protein